MTPTIFPAIAFPVLLAGGLLGPGWLLGRALRAPAGAIGALLGSAAILFHVVLALDALAWPLDLAHIGGALAGVSAALWLLGRRADSAPAGTEPAARGAIHYALWVPAALGLASITVKAACEPLSGFDTDFRWDFLARQMQRTATMSYYPPVSAEDFSRYGWCDGIAPFVADLYLWAYLALGRIAAWATTPLVLAQAGLLFFAVQKLAARLGPRAAGGVAVALFAAAALPLWSVAMGQETGLTALSLCAMFLFLENHRADGRAGWLVWAGLAAGTGALAREYALAYVPLGWLALASGRRRWREAGVFTLAAAAVALPWFLRNWLRTGNPLFDQDIAGLFPVNPAHLIFSHSLAGLTRFWADPAQLSHLARTLALLAGLPFLAALITLGRWRPAFAPYAAGILLVLILWLWSIGQTAAGLTYSMRVLAPALALAAALGGSALARLIESRRWRWLVAGVLAVCAGDAAIRALYLPFDYAVAWWRQPAGAWLEFGARRHETSQNPVWLKLAQDAAPGWILVIDPGHYTQFAKLGSPAVPLWSPRVTFVCDSRVTAADTLARLRADGARFVILPQHDVVADRLAAHIRFLHELPALSPPASLEPGLLVFDLGVTTTPRVAP